MPRPFTQNPGRRRRNLLLLLAGLSMLAVGAPGLFQPAAHAATTFTVNTTGDGADSNLSDNVCNDGGGNCSLRAAIQQANFTSGTDTINFSVTGTINLTAPLPMINTIIDINGPGSGLLTVRRDTGGSYRIFYINGGIVSLSGLTVTNGRTPDGAPTTSTGGNSGDIGAGIVGVGNLTLSDVVVTGNRTGDGGTSTGSSGGSGGTGGGIYASGTVIMTNVVISNNATGNGAGGTSGGAGGRGAGLYFSAGSLTMTNVTVSNNTTGNGANGLNSGASGGSGGSGGGIYIGSDTVTLTKVTVSGNTTGGAGNGGSAGFGGGIFTNTGVQSTLVDVVVSNNHTGDGGGGTAGVGGLGGGLMNTGIMSITRGTISGNNTGVAGATGGFKGGLGGGIFNSTSLTMRDSTVSGNSTHGNLADGGGIYNSGNVLSLVNCTISGNQANPVNDSTGGRGGGLYLNGSSVTLTNVTVTGNSAYTCCSFQSGQGVHSSGTVTVANTIIAGNANNTRPDVSGTYTSQGYNVIGAVVPFGSPGSDGQSGFTHGVNFDQVGTVAAPIDPVLGPLADNGGPSQTHALLAGSPALDRGSSTLAKDADGNALLTDQRGVGRIDSSTHLVDIGAYEYHPALEDVADKTMGEDTTLSVPFSVGDGGTPVSSVTAVSDNQTLVPDAGLSISGSGPVRTLQITPALNQSGTAQISLSVTYSTGTIFNDTFQLTVTPVNDAPSFTKGADQTVAEDAGPQSISDWATDINQGPNESGQVVSFQVTGNTNAALFSSAPIVTPAGTLMYTTANNANGSATITLVAKDNGGTAGGGQDTSLPQTFNINVTPVNDPPVVQNQSVTIPEDITTSIGFSANDPENNSVTYTIVSGPSHGTIGNGSVSVRTYTPAANYNGPDSFTYKATDSAGAESNTATVTINVTAVNDAPVNTIPTSQATDQNTTLVFSAANSNAISVSDVDAGTDPLRITLTITNGTLTLGGTTGLTFTAGDGTDDATMTFAGTTTDLNTALNGLAFKPNAGFSGFASLQITTNDQGSTGSGGARSDSDSVSIQVRPGSIEFKQSSYTAGEGAGPLAVVVKRTGDTSTTASVAYATDDGSIPSFSVPCASTTGAALDRCDFTKALGRLVFAPGETEKTINVLVGDDSYIEGTETALIRLSSVSGTNVALGSRTVATLEITDDVTESTANPIDNTGRFVRQHYYDFLNREPDADGLAFWTNEIEQCGADQQCREVKRINVSAAFFLSIEFQQTGYLVYRLDKVAFGNISSVKPVPLTLSEFLSDTQSIGQGVVVGALGWEDRLEANKRSFIDSFVLRTRFLSRYPTSTTPEAYVDALNSNAGGALLQDERDALVADLKSGAKTRAQVLRAVAEHANVVRRESNQAFVLMQYFGYLRRNPDDAPEPGLNFNGYNFWLGKLNEHNGNYVEAEMVKAFITSDEYRKRFGQ